MLLLAVVACGQLLVAGPARASGVSPRHVTPAAAYAVGVTRCTFVDRTRSTPNFQTTPPSVLVSTRTLVTEIRYPISPVVGGSTESFGATPALRSGGYPMIVFAHGYDATPDTYARLLDAWVRAGFIVAAPLFPDESSAGVAAQHGVNTEDDLWNEPADLTFVTRELLDASATRSASCPLVQGLIRASQLALAGHSDGATVVGILSYAHGTDPYGVSYQRLRAGLDFRATMILSGQVDGVDRYVPLSPDPALLVIQSAQDQCNPARKAIQLYRSVRQHDKWFLELRSAHHLPPFDGADVPAFNVVVNASVRFLRIAVTGSTRTGGLLAYGNAHHRIASMYHAGNGPADPPPVTLVSCGHN